MIIERIDIERFGGVADVTIDRLGAGVEVLHGTNETGKTSLLEFVRGVLFGFGSLFRRGVLDPERPCGGRLLVHGGIDDRRFTIDRHHLPGRSGQADDELAVRAADGPATPLFLRDYVGDIDEGTFTAVLAFGLDELHELRTLDADGCGSRLYELASGLDRATVNLALGNLRDALARLDSTDPDVSPLEALRQRRAGAVARLNAMNAPAVTAGGLATELFRLDASIAALVEARQAAEAHEAELRAAVPLEPLARQRRDSAQRLATIESDWLVHADLDAWQLARQRRDGVERTARARKRTRSRLARMLKALEADAAIWKRRSAVTALCEEEPRLERAIAEAARAETAARQAARRFGEQLGASGLARLATGTAPADSALPAGLVRSLAPLKSRAAAMMAASRDVRAARRTLAAATREAEGTRASFRGAAKGMEGGTIAGAIEEAAGRATLLRNRIASGDQLADLDKSLVRLEGELGTQVDSQLIPVPWLVGLGAVFVIGATMLLSGLFLPTSVTGSMAYALAALGLAGTGVASIATWSLDRAAAGRLDAVRQQREMVRRQREEAATQCGLLDKRIDAVRLDPPRSALDPGDWLKRQAAAAQAELERLEGIAAREGALHVLADRVTLAEQEVAAARRKRSMARSRWQRSLQQRGLPEDLSPTDVRQLSSHRRALLELDDHRRQTSEEARLRAEEVAAVGHRVEQFLVECDMLPEGNPLEQLRSLRERLDREASGQRQRGVLVRRLERARRRHRDALRQVKLADRRVREVVARWNVDAEDAFLALVDRRPLAEAARREALAADAAWSEARRRFHGVFDVDVLLTESHRVSLEERLADALAATARAAAAVARARDERAAAATRVEAAERDHCTEALQQEIATIERDIDAHVRRRTLLEIARGLLEETRDGFARDHQPAVLREASRWLERLTEGRYGAVTTSIHEARLEVHDHAGAVLNPDRLSRGTREQVFLSLRLALVKDLERRGVHLPVVIDDALVNFDDQRALAAARVLMEFATEQPGRQLLVLTCHAHVAAIFAEVGAHVRSLSEPRAVWTLPSIPVPAPLPQPVVEMPAVPLTAASQAAVVLPQAGRRLVVRPLAPMITTRPLATTGNPWVPRGIPLPRPATATLVAATGGWPVHLQIHSPQPKPTATTTLGEGGPGDVAADGKPVRRRTRATKPA
jgi:uncharacterized protein YhaN